MKYVVDRLEKNIVVLENISTKEMIQINKNKLGFSVSDGDILVYKNNKYYKDDNARAERLKMIQEKLNKVKGIK